MKKSILFVAVMLLCKLSIAQLVAVVDYMKVSDANGEAYSAVEKQWKLFHQAKVNEGKIVGWNMYWVVNSGSQSDYNFVTVTLYENLEKSLNSGITLDELKKFYGDKWTDLSKRTSSSRALTRSASFIWYAGINDKENTKYVMITEMNAPDLEKYLAMEKTAYQPAHAEAIAAGKLNGWGVWTRLFPEDTNYNAVTVNSYKDAAQVAANPYEGVLEKLKGKTDGDKFVEMVGMFNETDKLRSMVFSQLWEKLDGTTPKK